MNPHLNPQAAVARYRGVQVKTCSPLQLLVMLYEGALRFVSEADAAMAKGDRARAGDRIGRAHAILEELAATLDPSSSPELCENLLALYAFGMRMLVEANLEQDPKKLADVSAALTPLRDGFAALNDAK